jgi:hypothetical protein
MPTAPRPWPPREDSCGTSAPTRVALNLIHVKAAIGATGMLSPKQEISQMPTESLLVTVFVVAMFVVFAAVLFWGDRQTQPKQLADSPQGKRRAF